MATRRRGNKTAKSGVREECNGVRRCLRRSVDSQLASQLEWKKGWSEDGARNREIAGLY